MKLSRVVMYFRKHGGILRSREFSRLRIKRGDIAFAISRKYIQKLSRGVYALPDAQFEQESIEQIKIFAQVPKGIFCLTSALAFHDIAVGDKNIIYVALKRGARIPNLVDPRIRFCLFTEKAFTSGVMQQSVFGEDVDGQPPSLERKVKIYSLEKSIADCFKYRNKIGIDVAVRALYLYLNQSNKPSDLLFMQKKIDIPQLLYFADICRVRKMMEPYIASISAMNNIAEEEKHQSDEIEDANRDPFFR